MKMLRNFRLMLSTLLVTCASLMAAPTYADAQLFSADLCDPLAPGVKHFKKKFGEIRNFSDTKILYLSCPIAVDFNQGPYFVEVNTWNYASQTETTKCILRELDPQSFVISTYTRTVATPSNGSLPLQFEGITPLSVFNRFHLACNVPPEGAIGQMVVEGPVAPPPS